MRPDIRLHRVHYDWLEAGEHTQRTVARLSEQLRRFLDDQAWLENRRIMDILRNIESRALGLRQQQPPGNFMPLSDTSVTVDLALERPLYHAPFKPVISDLVMDEGDADVDAGILYAQIVVDRAELTDHIRQALKGQRQVSLAEVVSRYPLRHGLAELVTYLQLAADWPDTVVDDEVEDQISWEAEDGVVRRASLPRIILLRNQ